MAPAGESGLIYRVVGFRLATRSRVASIATRDRSTSRSIDLPITASSCVAVLPKGDGRLPVLWWSPAVPSSSCYGPFFVHSSRLPDAVSRAGTHGRNLEPPSKVTPDSFAPESYWWQFRDLSNLTAAARKNRGPVVRDAFDELEMEFAAMLPSVLEEAGALKRAGRADEAASVLDTFTAECVERAMKSAGQLREQFAAEPAAEVPDQYKPYIGSYLANFGPFSDVKFRVVMRDDKMAVDVPGQNVFELKDPNEQGKSYFALTHDIALSFDRDASRRVVGMRMHQAGATFELPRTDTE